MEIILRAWDKKEKIMIDMEYPTYFAANCDRDILDLVWFLECLQEQTGDGPEADRYILMRYTGLKDKNKKMIYEEDIINRISGYHNGKPIYEPREVVFHQHKDYPNRTTWLLRSKEEKENKEEGIFNIWDLDEIEVIGNKFENKDLLK